MLRRGFIQHAVRQAIGTCGGIDAVASALHYSTSHVGSWNCQTDKDLPGIEQALDLDDLSISCGGRAEILRAMATRLGHVVFRLPEGFGNAEAVTVQLAKATGEFGDIAQAVVAALGDGEIDGREAGLIAHQIDEAMEALVKMRALVIEEESSAVRVAKVAA
jgi:hypothetical protein